MSILTWTQGEELNLQKTPSIYYTGSVRFLSTKHLPCRILGQRFIDHKVLNFISSSHSAIPQLHIYRNFGTSSEFVNRLSIELLINFRDSMNDLIFLNVKWFLFCVQIHIDYDLMEHRFSSRSISEAAIITLRR